MSHVLDRIAREQGERETSRLVGVDPRVRIVVAIAFAVVVVMLDRLGPLLAANGLAVLAAVAATLPVGATVRRLVTVDAFIIATLLILPFSMPGEPLFTLGPLTATEEGVWRAIAIALKANAIVLTVMALVGTMEPATIGQALARLGVPFAFVHLLLFTVRFVNVLGGEYQRLRLAMRARAFRPRNTMHTWRSLGYLMGMVLVRSVERSERVLAAMKCRGYTGQLYILDTFRFGRLDPVCALVAVAGLGALLLWDAGWPSP